jgi:hypothetical protein
VAAAELVLDDGDAGAAVVVQRERPALLALAVLALALPGAIGAVGHPAPLEDAADVARLFLLVPSG